MSKPLRVLVVDDSEIAREYHRMLLLTDLLIQSESCGSLAEAAARIGRGGIDVVLLDLYLPDAEGLEALLALRKLSPSVSIVVVSGTEGADMHEHALAGGAKGYLPKSGLTGAALLAAVRQAAADEFAPLKESLDATAEAIQKAEEIEQKFEELQEDAPEPPPEV